MQIHGGFGSHFFAKASFYRGQRWFVRRRGRLVAVLIRGMRTMLGAVRVFGGRGITVFGRAVMRRGRIERCGCLGGLAGAAQQQGEAGAGKQKQGGAHDGPAFMVNNVLTLVRPAWRYKPAAAGFTPL